MDQHQVTKSGNCVITGCPCRGWSAQETAAVPCSICSTPTRMLGTELCDRCWELKTRIENDPDIARRILTATASEPAARGGGEEWRVQVAGSNVYILDQNGNAIANLHNERIAREIVEQREQHQALVAERERLRVAIEVAIDNLNAGSDPKFLADYLRLTLDQQRSTSE